MSLKKILCLAFFLSFSAMLSASSVLELVGAQDSVHPFTSRIISTGAEAAYFNPADLATLDDSFKIGFGMTIQNKSISHAKRPDGHDVGDYIYDFATATMGTGIDGYNAPLPTANLINKRGSADYDSFDGVIMLGAVKNIAKKSLEKLGGQLAVGVYALLPISGIQTQEPFFNDEREQYFSNSLQFELYGDRLKQFSAAVALAGRFGRYFRIGAGLAISTYTKTQNRVFVPNASDPSLQLINAKMNVGASVMPYFSFVANPVAGWHLTGTFHFPTNTGIVKLNNEMQVLGLDNLYPENQRYLTASSSMTAGYQPIKVAVGTYYNIDIKNDYQITPMAGFEWSRWSTYINRHGEKPLDKWNDTFSATAGLMMRHPERRAAFGFNYVPSPVPAQTGRENYVDNDRMGFSLGYHEYFGITDQVKIGAGISGSLQWLLSRTEEKDLERSMKDGGLVDEVPDDDTKYYGDMSEDEVKAIKEELQTNNPGFPGWTSKGFLLNIGISAEVIW
ncbi:hypothetical protein IKS86_00950 [bacterium]|nr:hypothetical protein [bacterium]